MKKEEYEELRRKRDEISRLLKGPTLPSYKIALEKQLETIRTTIKNAHREQYNEQRTIGNK